MTPEQREELKALALKVQPDYIWREPWEDYRREWEAASTPSAILSLIAQVEAMTRKTVELERVYDERGLQIDRLEVELQRVHEAKIETQPAHEEIIRTGSMLMCTACGTTSKEPAWETLPEVYFDEDAAPTIPAIPGTKEGA